MNNPGILEQLIIKLKSQYNKLDAQGRIIKKRDFKDQIFDEEPQIEQSLLNKTFKEQLAIVDESKSEAQVIINNQQKEESVTFTLK